MYVLLDKFRKIVDIQSRPFTVAAPYVWEAVPEGVTPRHGMLFIDCRLVDPEYPTLASTQQKHAKALSETCATLISSGFTSSATGASLFYASNDVDQRNIAQRSQAPGGGLISCKDSSGVWARRAHTQAQAQGVLNDFVKFSDSLRAALTALEEKIQACTTIDQVLAIVWPPSVSPA